MLTKTSDDGGVAWEDINISGVPLGTILPIGVNFPTPQGFVNISYSQPSYHPVAGMAADFVVGYYCGDAKNATADFGYRCANIDGTGRSTTGAYIALEPAANQFYRVMDDIGARDPFMLHEDRMQGHVHPQQKGSPITGAGAYGGMGQGPATADANMDTLGPVSDGINGTVRIGAETVPKHIDKKFIMKIADGVVGDPALVDWQAYLDAFTELSAIKVNYSDFTGSNQLLSGNGYQMLPGGLILQWGMRPDPAVSGDTTVVFNVAFPSVCLFAIAQTNWRGGTNATFLPTFKSSTKEQAIFFIANTESAGAESGPFNWFAIGN